MIERGGPRIGRILDVPLSGRHHRAFERAVPKVLRDLRPLRRIGWVGRPVAKGRRPMRFDFNRPRIVHGIPGAAARPLNTHHASISQSALDPVRPVLTGAESPLGTGNVVPCQPVQESPLPGGQEVPAVPTHVPASHDVRDQRLRRCGTGGRIPGPGVRREGAIGEVARHGDADGRVVPGPGADRGGNGRGDGRHDRDGRRGRHRRRSSRWCSRRCRAGDCQSRPDIAHLAPDEGGDPPLLDRGIGWGGPRQVCVPALVAGVLAQRPGTARIRPGGLDQAGAIGHRIDADILSAHACAPDHAVRIDTEATLTPPLFLTRKVAHVGVLGGRDEIRDGVRHRTARAEPCHERTGSRRRRRRGHATADPFIHGFQGRRLSNRYPTAPTHHLSAWQFHFGVVPHGDRTGRPGRDIGTHRCPGVVVGSQLAAELRIPVRVFGSIRGDRCRKRADPERAVGCLGGLLDVRGSADGPWLPQAHGRERRE